MARTKGTNNDPDIGQTWTDCICPRCKKKHQLKLFWVGKLPARKFCLACIAINSNFNSSIPYSFTPKPQGYVRAGQP